jgi:hypothetical protein
MVVSAVTDAYEEPLRQGAIVTAAWAACAKEVMSHQGAAAVQDQMDKCYRTLRLRDDQGQWATPKIAAMGENLLPTKLTLADINKFVDEIKQANDRNGYLMDFAEAMPNRDVESSIESLQRSAGAVIPEIIGFAMVLQALTASFNNNVEWVAEIMSHWEREAQSVGSYNRQGLLFRLKHASVYAPIRKSHQIVRLGKVPENFCNFHLPFNILQASAYNYLMGQKANAAAGYALSKHYPGNIKNKATGAGPVHLSPIGNLLETGFPLAEKWADLYQSWNLAFGAQFDSFPLYLCKLVIPQVAGYQDAPQRYVWDRTNALMTYLYFSGFAADEKSRGKMRDSVFYKNQWSAFDKGNLCRLWGEVNKKSAADYMKSVNNATRNQNESIR